MEFILTNASILTRLVELYFGNEVQEYSKLLDRIISCQKLDDFLALDLSFESERLTEVFDKANQQTFDTNVLPARYDAIFKQVRAVQAHADFI